MKPPPQGEWADGLFGARLFLIMSSGYFMSYGLRAVNATIAPELVEGTGLSNAELGSLTSAYFLAFAVLQLPLGVWLDRFGPRRVDAALIAVAAAGCLVFAISDSFAGLWTGRALLGAGFAAGLMAPFALFRIWFPPRLQTRMAAWTLMVGTAGVLVATLPVRALLAVMDWRGVFVACALVLVLIAATMWFGVPSQREPAGRGGPSFFGSLAGYADVGRSRFFWRMVLMGGVMQGGFIALQTLWLGPWFTRVLLMTPQQSAAWLFGFNAALLAAYLLTGYLAPRLGHQESTVIRLSAIAVGLTALLIALVAAAPAFAGVWAWLLVAAIHSVFTPIQARVGLSFPKHLTGRALTAYNLMVFVAVFGLQMGAGLLVDGLIRAGLSEVDAFRSGLAALAATQAVTWILFVFWPPSPAAAGAASPQHPVRTGH